jgi:type VI secretion system protein ImpL
MRNGSMLYKDIMRIVLYGVGLGSLASLVYFAGPLIAFGDFRPLENHIVREIVILLLVSAAASFAGFKFYLRKKSSAELAKGIAEQGKEDSDADILKDKMKDALATLKAASGGRADYLYDLPWYLLIGPPGAGKTTALVNSGLKFPLSRGATPAAVAGIGGTRYCDWWFTEEAVLIDTAGRYTTQDSDARADKTSWLAFLDLLKKNRPRQPINGVLVAISIHDLMTLGPAEIAAHANAIRARLLELHERLKVDFPVYALFTKADLVAGFVEYFGQLGEQGRKQVWGATFQTSDKTRNLVGEIPVEFDALIERLSEEITDRLQDEPAPARRVALFGLPAQMTRLRQPIFDFLNQIFEPTRYHANATLRGFYFTSGTQQGTPIDQLIGALVRSFGAEHAAVASYSGLGKSFFLTDLIQKVIIGEAAWVSTDRAAVRRAMIMKAAAFTLIGLLSIAAAGAWWISYQRNSALIAQMDAANKEYAAAAGPLARETLIGDRDFGRILPLLHRLKLLPAGFANRDAPTPLAATFGLSQRERLQSSAERAYHLGLERMFRPRLLFRLEELLESRQNDPGFVYEALKVYMMLGGLQPADRDLITSWMRQDWERLYPGAAYAEGRKALEEHLVAMLDLEDSQELLVTLNGRLIEDSQKTLGRLSVAQRAYELLKSQARTGPAHDWVASRQGGPDAALVFDAPGGLDAVRIPGFFTYAGFHREFIGRLGDIADRLKKERWVLGPIGEQSAVAAQYDTLPDDLLDIYGKEFVAVWREALSRLRMRKLLADKPKYIALSALSGTTSPLRQILESIRDETTLTRERKTPPADVSGGATANAAPNPLPAKSLPVMFKNQDRAPGANIEATFKAFHVVVEGDAMRRPIDDIIANLNEIARNLTLSASAATPSQVAQANTALQTQVATLRTNAARLPPPFSDMLRAAAAEFEGDVATSTAGQLLLALRDQVIPACQQTIANKYPFTRGSDRDVPLADFARLFGPNGVLDKFFNQYLAPYADTSKREWAWRQDSPIAGSLSPSTLRDFQRAAEIRDAFFQSGGNMPMVTLAVTPPVLSDPGISAKFEIGGNAIVSPSASAPALPGSRPQPVSNSPATVQWPGPSTHAAISLTIDAIGQPSILERTGPWSLFRILEAGAVQVRAEKASARFIVGGRELSYQISTGSIRNPLNLAALREFRCPSGI